MRSAMRFLFWGYLLVLLSIRINGFDILPDVVGYALILTAFTKLDDRVPTFREGRIPAGIGCVLSILDLAPFLGGDSLAFALILSLVEFFLFWWLLYCTFTGLAEVAGEFAAAAGEREPAELHDDLLTKRQIFVILQFIVTGGTVLGMLIPPLMIPVLLLSLIYTIWMLSYLHKTGDELAEFEEVWHMDSDHH